MVHKQDSKAVSNHHLLRRKGVYYYRRRVPLHLVATVGKKLIQFSLDTTDIKEARKRRAVCDIQWDARFDAHSASPADDQASVQRPANSPLSKTDLLELVRDYVARHDRDARKRESQCYLISAKERTEMQIDAEVEAQSLRAHDDLHHRWVYLAGTEALKSAGKSFKDADVPGEIFAELVRRGLVELNRRYRARLADDHSRSFFDQLFDPSRPRQVTFGELAGQHLQLVEEDGAINGLGAKGLDRQRATVSLVREIVGDNTPVVAVDYDACLRLRTTLARLPANKTMLYGDLPIDQAIELAAKQGKPLLAPVTQERYLAALRDILDLAAKKRLITVNPADGLRPIKRDAIAASDKRKPFTLQQIVEFFNSSFYADCAKHSPPFAHDKGGWRFWLPLICLFLGMRPNEAAQMHAEDFKRTKKGTWYLDVVATADEDDSSPAVTAKKTLKTAASRRRIPLHPELIKIGLLEFVAERKKAGGGPRLFPALKPDGYGNCATYALKRFRELYLSSAIKLEARQTFYSFRHSWRDALRRIDAQPATLQALGAWSQGKLTSDDYGDKADPDFQAQFIEKISFPGLDLSFLHAGSSGSAPVSKST
jgi:integrase